MDGSRADGHIVAQRHNTSSPQPIKTNVMSLLQPRMISIIQPPEQVIGKVLRKT
jgi:hypothetical protein